MGLCLLPSIALISFFTIITTMPRNTKAFFRVFASNTRTTSGTTFTKLNLTPGNLGTRTASLGQCFEFFRISKLRVWSLISANNVGTATLVMGSSVDHAIAFDSDVSADVGTPTSLADIQSLRHLEVGNVWQKVEIKVGPRDLYQSTPTKWYNVSSTGSPPGAMSSAGTVIYRLGVAGTGTLETVNQIVFIEGEMEFSTPVDPAILYSIRVPDQVAEEPQVKAAKANLERIVEKLSAL